MIAQISTDRSEPERASGGAGSERGAAEATQPPDQLAGITTAVETGAGPLKRSGLTPRGNPSGPVIRDPAQITYDMVRQEMGDLAIGLRGYSLTVFVQQLAFALWLVTAKIKMKNRVASLFLYLETLKFLPRKRNLNCWCEALLALLKVQGLITAPPRKPGGKQPRPSIPEQLYVITWEDLWRIAPDYGSMQAVRRKLMRSKTRAPRPKSAKGKEAEIAAWIEQTGAKVGSIEAELAMRGPLRGLLHVVIAKLAQINTVERAQKGTRPNNLNGRARSTPGAASIADPTSTSVPVDTELTSAKN